MRCLIGEPEDQRGRQLVRKPSYHPAPVVGLGGLRGVCGFSPPWVSSQALVIVLGLLLVCGARAEEKSSRCEQRRVRTSRPSRLLWLTITSNHEDLQRVMTATSLPSPGISQFLIWPVITELSSNEKYEVRFSS